MQGIRMRHDASDTSRPQGRHTVWRLESAMRMWPTARPGSRSSTRRTLSVPGSWSYVGSDREQDVSYHREQSIVVIEEMLRGRLELRFTR